jgi:outer membrane protein TolC
MEGLMKYFLLAVAYLLLCGQVWAVNIHDLLNAVSRQPGMEISNLAVEEGGLQQKAASAALFPKIALFGRGELYNSPTNLRPMPPTEVNVTSGDSIPFSRRILRYGLTLEVPLYVQKIYDLREKTRILHEKAKIENRIDLVSRQAAVISLNSSYQYLRSLDQAIAGRMASLDKTRADVTLKVKNGRTPESELLKINTSINDLAQQKNLLTAKRLDVMRDIKKLTGIDLTDPVPMVLTGKIVSGPFIAMEAQKKQVQAAMKEVSRRRAARYPTLSLYGGLSGNEGEAYNTDSPIYRSYNTAGIVMTVPLFDQTITKDVEIAKVEWEKSRKKLAEIRIELHALSDDLNAQLPVIDQSIKLAKQSVEDNKTLLVIARVAFESGRMTTEDYLRYESQKLAAEATLFQAEQQRWQLLAQQAVLYGTDLKGVVE